MSQSKLRDLEPSRVLQSRAQVGDMTLLAATATGLSGAAVLLSGVVVVIAHGGCQAGL